jgi:hypothetical protein
MEQFNKLVIKPEVYEKTFSCIETNLKQKNIPGIY